MSRLLPALLLLAAFACDKDPRKAEADKGGAAAKAAVPPKPPVLPTTGSPQIRKMREDILDDIEGMEKDLDAGKQPEKRFVDAARKNVDHLLTATRMAVDKEAVELVRRELAMLRTRQAALDKARSDLAAGILEIQGILDRIQRGVDKPPEGFTVDELKDRLGKKQEEARALEKEETEIRAQMQGKEDLLNGGKIEPQGPTVLTHELEAAQELKTRLDALEARLPK
ncbi:MAG TPA: hypothetical protein VFY93_07440 [Planctomycetota bacterium]|nr:hypothetical protein [Planctomycetota bacterium]